MGREHLERVSEAYIFIFVSDIGGGRKGASLSYSNAIEGASG